MSRKEGRDVAEGRTVERAVVVEVKDDSAILLTRSGAFVSRPGAHLALGDETLVDMTPVPVRGGLRTWHLGLAGGVAAALAVTLVLASMTPAYAKTVAYTSVEINPAFTLGLNAKGQVTTIAPEDADATKVLAGVQVIGKSLPSAVDALVRASVTDGFVASSGFTPVIVAAYGAGSSPIPTSIKPIVAQATRSAKGVLAALAVTGEAQGVAVDQAVVTKAKKLGLSVGEYVVMAELQRNGKSVSGNDVKEGLGKVIQQSDSQTLFQDLTNTLSQGASGPFTPPPPPPAGSGSGLQVQVNVPSGIEGIDIGDGADGQGKGHDHGHGNGHGQKGTGDQSGTNPSGQGVPPQGPTGDQGQTAPGSGDQQNPFGQGGQSQKQGGSGGDHNPSGQGDNHQGPSGSGGQNGSNSTGLKGSGSSYPSFTWPLGNGDTLQGSASWSNSFCSLLSAYGFSCSDQSGVTSGGSGGSDGSGSTGDN